MTLIKIEWRNGIKSLILWSAAVMVILGLFMAVFPTMQSSGMKDIVNTKLDAMPSELLKMFNLQGGTSLLEVTGYFAYVFQYLFLAAGIYAVLLGATALVKEETDGTIDFLYAQPLSRRDIVFYKQIANTLLLALFWLFTWLFSFGIIYVFKEKGSNWSTIVSQINRVFLNEGLVLLLLFAIGFCFSPILKSSKQTTGVALGFIFGTYILGILSEINSKVEWLKNVSPLHYAVPSTTLNENMKGIHLLICVMGIIAFSGLSYFFYEKKDFKG
ncbi:MULTISPECIES: ABC transporter permease subunit [Carnobacterium]|uniref:ABC transporter permease subunit n=1 Tax=Carnobacterium TaxID=2747 RepID=UPI001072E9CA|nr:MULTISPECIES: ABC transporter permease subunit [Carnobacterium]MDT1938669.1 ABC transporter permease [Carnobacterium divergens]MDT1941107.1 ABC transporter permease [Carnobacterium divergens]MDT1946905.1 ABC transporter permease [Carnobacterium divergens]MDT1949342.1 ABC transporter permease [Carnobacterium divergens]MDT1954520.1 ABC transporter permease [Carnobacterium divergens]